MSIWNQKIKEFDPKSSTYIELQTVDEAEALVTTYPNSSKAWILYIIYYLNHVELNKARAIAEKALQTINFREDLEKLNVWKALLNIESKYGSSDTFENVLKRALQYQDQLKVYKHVIDLYVKNEKIEELEKLSTVVLKKFKNDKDIWLQFATFYMQKGKFKEARNILTRSLQCISNKECADVLSKFADLEYKHGDLERSFTMYEEILAKYPKRKDLKSIYIQKLKAQGQDERVQALLISD
ncbi:protein RRP5 homolog [Parasteatoda tepidariorum]|nr:protein RRP5 homolog [Parasteatoda tepidariorum]